MAHKLFAYYKTIPIIFTTLCILVLSVYWSKNSSLNKDEESIYNKTGYKNISQSKLSSMASVIREGDADNGCIENSSILTQEDKQFILSEIKQSKTWKCVYTSEKDALLPSALHQAIDDKGAFIIVIRTEDGSVLGAYTSVGMISSHGNGYCYGDPLHFLFTLKNPYNTGRVRFTTTYPETAISFVSEYGPCFGDYDDLCIRGKDGHFSQTHVINFPHSYKDTTGIGKNVFCGKEMFAIKDLEVFM